MLPKKVVISTNQNQREEYHTARPFLSHHKSSVSFASHMQGQFFYVT